MYSHGLNNIYGILVKIINYDASIRYKVIIQLFSFITIMLLWRKYFNMLLMGFLLFSYHFILFRVWPLSAIQKCWSVLFLILCCRSIIVYEIQYHIEHITLRSQWVMMDLRHLQKRRISSGVAFCCISKIWFQKKIVILSNPWCHQ